MNKLIALILFLLSSSCWGFNHDVVKGQWALYENNYISNDYYYFLNINDDFTGVLIWSFDNKPMIREFVSKDVIKRDGYIEIELESNKKFILSAWKLKSGAGRLSGQLYLYKENGELFNMINFPLHLLEKNHKFLEYKEIKKHAETYR